MEFKKILIFGAGGMLGTTLKNLPTKNGLYKRK